ncbi:hypothetical protein BDZ89DRAFT_1070680, partial [Hymenopellis radicata]
TALHIRRFPSSSITFANMPSTVTVSVTDATVPSLDLPTHLVACFSTPRARVFRTEIIPSNQPIPSFTRTNQNITLPLVIPAITIPHPPSLAFLLLQDLSENDVAFQMLPPNVVGEFPNAAAMAQVMSFVGNEEFERRMVWNGGMWRNVLGLGLQNERLVGVVRTAWNVTADARRLRPY